MNWWPPYPMDNTDGRTFVESHDTGISRGARVLTASERQLMRGMDHAERMAFAEHLSLLEDQRA